MITLVTISTKDGEREGGGYAEKAVRSAGAQGNQYEYKWEQRFSSADSG
jgi:hypothetical protein